MRREQFQLRARGNQTLAAVEYVTHVPAVRRHHGDAEEGSPVQVEMPGLRDGHVETPADLGEHGPDDRPLLLQRTHVTEQDVEFQGAYEHGLSIYR